MVISDDPVECLARAAIERDLANAATLDNVRERHLRSARTWEELASRIERMTKSQTENRANLIQPSAAAERGRLGGNKRADNLTAEQRSEMARQAARKRWGRSPKDDLDG